MESRRRKTPEKSSSWARTPSPTTFLQRLSEKERTELMADIERLKERGDGSGRDDVGPSDAAAGDKGLDGSRGSSSKASGMGGNASAKAGDGDGDGDGGSTSKKSRVTFSMFGDTVEGSVDETEVSGLRSAALSADEEVADTSMSPLAYARLRVQSQSLSKDVEVLQEHLDEATSTLTNSEIKLQQQAERHNMRMSRSEQRYTERIAELEYRLEEAQQTYSKLAAASEAIASDNVELSGRLGVLTEERDDQVKVIGEQEERIAHLQRLYLMQQQLQHDPVAQMTTTHHLQYGILTKSETTSRVSSSDGHDHKACGTSQLEKFFADIATKGELHSFVNRSRPPADFQGPSEEAVGIQIHGNSVIQRLKASHDSLRAQLLDAEKKQKQLHTQLVDAVDEKKRLQMEQARSTTKYESVIVGSLRRIAWLLKREEELREKEKQKDAYIKKIETKLLRLHEALNAGMGGRSQIVSPSVHRRRAGARAQGDAHATDVKSLASTKKKGSLPVWHSSSAKRDSGARGGKMSKLMRGDWDDEQMRDIFDVRVDLSQELEAHHRDHHLATADADADNNDGDDDEAVEKYNSDVKARIGMSTGVEFLDMHGDDGLEESQPLTISEVRNFTRQLEALHNRNIGNIL